MYYVDCCLQIVGLLCVVFACLAFANDEPSPPAHYDFAYAVNDPETGDQKDQQETRNGDDVTGYYRTLDADGYLRTVKYKSDAVNGFTAEVVREPVSGAVVPAPAAKVAKVTAYVKPVAPVQVAPIVQPAVVPFAAPTPSYYQPAVPYQYQPSYSYGYQPYPYAYSPYAYGGPYPYPYSGQYPYPGPSPTVRK